MKENPHFSFDFHPPREEQIYNQVEKPEKIKVGDFTLLRISDLYLEELAILPECQGFVIRSTNQHCTRELLSRIRLSHSNNLMLSPIFIEVGPEPIDGLQNLTVDALIEDVSDLRKYLTRISHIQQRLSELQIPSQLRYEEEVLHTLLGYMYTRSIEQIVPVQDVTSRSGFRYPILSDYDLIHHHRTLHQDILQQGEEHGLFYGDFAEVSYVCNQCSGGFLHYREVCPKCLTAHISTHEMVHHFRCAHVAPLKDFQRFEDSISFLHCPKCNHNLKHIGIDYDKPSQLHHCHSCEHEFQFFSVKAKCVSCSNDQLVDHLIKKEFKAYTVTQRAITAICEGALVDELRKDPNKIDGALSWNLFTQNIEFERSTGKSDHLHIFRIELPNLSRIQRRIGMTGTRQLVEEMLDVIKASQSVLDYRCVLLPYIYLSLRELTGDQAAEIVERTSYLLDNLLSDNLPLEISPLTFERVDQDQLLTVAESTNP